MQMWYDAQTIMRKAIAAVRPEAAVQRALGQLPACQGRRLLVAVGKAACPMAAAAMAVIGETVSAGIVITKYGHALPMPTPLRVQEAGHPYPDAATYAATAQVLALTENLCAADQVIFLLSGGGSALFEAPWISTAEMEQITRHLLCSGAEITQINTVRKRLSGVKGGRFALHCAPAQVFCIALSDVLGDRLDMIASGPTCPDCSTSAQAMQIVAQYDLPLSAEARACLQRPTPERLYNVHNQIVGSVRHLCEAAADCCRSLGYPPIILDMCLQGSARDAGRWLARQAMQTKGRRALLAGGETVVHVTGDGMGGRNQELALAAAAELAGCAHIAVFSFGSDGTDGPTDAAGGYVDGQTQAVLQSMGYPISAVLAKNDAYHALRACGGLLFTGPTGTNVNDLSVALIEI